MSVSMVEVGLGGHEEISYIAEEAEQSYAGMTPRASRWKQTSLPQRPSIWES